MSLAGIEWRSLAAQHAARRVAVALIDLEYARGVYDFSRLAIDPAEEIAAAGEVGVRIDSVAEGECGLAGVYHPAAPGPQIVVHPSASVSHDAFTVLHEFGHHLQYSHLPWADVWTVLPDSRRLTEDVADAIAGEILIPDDQVRITTADVTAQALANAYRAVSTASRSAVAHRALRDATPADDLTVAVCDVDGRVVFARSSGNLMAPRRGAVQDGFAQLVARAQAGSGSTRGELNPGLVAASGVIQDGLTASVSLDDSGAYAFVVVRPTHRYSPPTWQRDERECPNPACGAIFETTDAGHPCRQCGDYRCPECGACSCEPGAALVCAQCNTVLSAAERAGTITHECW